jgi:hypothetical protein
MNACVHTYTKPQTSSTRNRGPCWRIHGSVEDTKLSTNKQHTLSLVVRASKPIKRQETVLVHYNPRGGIQSWETVFKCTCCLCRGKCGPSALSSGNTDRSFTKSIRQVQHNGVLSEKEITRGDFVSTPQKDFWGNVMESHAGGVQV